MNTPYILGSTHRKLHQAVDTYAQGQWQAGRYIATECFFFLLKSLKINGINNKKNAKKYGL